MVRLSTNAKKVTSIFKKVSKIDKKVDFEDLDLPKRDFLKISKGANTNNSIFKAISYILTNTNDFKIKLKTDYLRQINDLCVKVNNSINDTKRGYLTELIVLVNKVKQEYGEVVEFRFLPSKSKNASRGESLYQHSGYYFNIMEIQELSALQFRQNCQCGVEVLNA